MTRALLGFFKGLLLGSFFALGFLFFNLSEDTFTSSILSYLGCGLLGAVVGFVCGRAPWKSETFWIPLLRVIAGSIVGVLIYGLGHAFLPSVSLVTISQISSTPIVLNSVVFLAPVIGLIYGTFVEIDDGESAKETKKVLTGGTS